MTNEEKQGYANQLKEFGSLDPEEGHELADNLLCEILVKLGYPEFAEEFKKLERWYT